VSEALVISPNPAINLIVVIVNVTKSGKEIRELTKS
jgi:hypothetical protein